MKTWLYQRFLYFLVHAHVDLGSPYTGRSPTERWNRQPDGRQSTASPNSMSREYAADRAGSRQRGSNNPASFSDHELAVLHSLIASGIDCNLKTMDARSCGHRHHGLWYVLRSIMCASLILLAVVNSSHAAWIPGGFEVRWGSATAADYLAGSSVPIEGKIAKVLSQFDFWAGEGPDLFRYKEILETAVRDVRGF